MNGNTKKSLENRARLLMAALDIWEGGGIHAVSHRAVGKRCGISGQRVQQIFKSSYELKKETAELALKTQRTAVILQLRALGMLNESQ